VILTLALVCLLGAAGATVDVGQMLMITSRAQGIADACALAAAGGPIISQAGAVEERVQQTIDANNHATLPAVWDPDELVYYGHGQTVPGYGPIGPQDEAVAVRVRITGHHTFSRIFGLSSQVIERRATALRTPAAGGDCIVFAIDPGTNHLGIDLSGSRGIFEGAIHSNTRVDITGSQHHFMGAVEWANRLRVTGSGTVFDVADVETPVQDPPVVYEVSDFEPFDYVINGNYSVPSSGVVPPGCYRVHGNVHVTGSSKRLENVTFVADGTIQFSGSNHYYTPNRHNVFAYSLSNDNTGAIRIAGSAPNCRGTLYAPAGNIAFSGSGMSFTSMIGWTIDISGSDFHVQPSLEGGSRDFAVRLIG